jgi:carbon-monoxide dehydrogenase medium subunit
MKFPAFSYAAPADVREATRLLVDHEDSRPLAGGQTLLPLMAMRLAAPSLLVDLGRIRSLSQIEVNAKMVRIGSMVTHARNQVAEENRAHLPLLVQALHHVAHAAVRNRGTIGGSIAHADAAAEMPLVATALDATMIIEGVLGTREVPAADFFLGHYTTALQAGELLTAIHFPFSSRRWAFAEVARRPGDFALVMTAVGLEMRAGRCESARVVVGCLYDRPTRIPEVEEFLRGRPVDQETVIEAARLATEAAPPRKNIHASAEYRSSVAGVIVRRALLQAANGG